MTKLSLRCLGLALLLVGAATAAALAQGRTDYLNPESPQGHPIEVFRLGGHDYLAVVNTRDGSVEVWDTDETATERRLARVRVGQEPVTVRFNPRLSQLFTANFLGDSVSAIAVSAPAGPASFTAQLLRTTWVGDEPVDVAFYPRVEASGLRETFFVTHMSPDGFGWRDALTFAPVQAGFGLVPAQVDIGDVDLAAKEPRTVLVRGDQLLVLPLKGYPNGLVSAGADLDLYCDDLTAPFVQPSFLGGLHTTGFNMAFDAAGVLYIVGGEALDGDLQDEPAVAAAPTGFLKSMVFRVEDPCSASPSVLARDVNLAPTPVQQTLVGGPAAVTAQPVVGPVPKGRALSMLTDVAVFDTAGGQKVFFTAFGNDRVGVLEPDPSLSSPNLWPRRKIEVAPRNGNPLAGPNGLALKPADPSAPSDPGPRLYVLNHLDGSITTIDPVTETVVAGAGMSLAHDPRPAYLTTGQRFLYDAKLSGTGFVSCASCHIYARTDGRPWDLGLPPPAPDEPIPALLPDAVEDTVFPADKNRMVTQSLQGLLNFEVDRSDQIWTTNAPYHWGGDRSSFLAFKPAFESLLLGAGITDQEMAQFEAFVNSIHYPPNPKQRRDRQPSGTFGVGEDLGSDGSTGAFRGLKIFHAKATVGPRGCAVCHALPEASNNRITDPGVNGSGMQVGQPIETAALRGLFQKEAKRDLDGSTNPAQSAYTGLEGLFHTGLIPNPDPTELGLFNVTASINAFNRTAFSQRVCGAPNAHCPDLQALNQFVHEIDWGVGPLVGCPATVGAHQVSQAQPGNPTSLGCDGACTHLASTLDCMEQQADRANSGVSVQAWLNGAERGFWYDPLTGTYREEPAGIAPVNRTGLLALLGAERDRLVFQAVPLGSERRLAAPSGASSGPLTGPAPTPPKLLPMVAGDFYTRVPELQGAWAGINNSTVPGDNGLGSIFLHTVRLYQWGLILEAPAENGFGLGQSLRHDAPRRFQVAAENVRHGARLWLAHHDDPAAGPPDPDGPLDQVQTSLIGLPLYPTDEVDPVTGRPIWQTAVELEPLAYYGLMLGGPKAPGVAAAYVDQKPFTFTMVDPKLDQPAAGQFDPLAWNFLYVAVVNADGTVGDGGWQRLRIE